MITLKRTRVSTSSSSGSETRSPDGKRIYISSVGDLGVESEVKVYADLPKEIRERRQKL